MQTRRCLKTCACLAISFLAGGCAFGFGTPFPDAPERESTDDVSYVNVDRETGEVVSRASVRSRRGGGDHGFTIGLSLGPGSVALGEQTLPVDPAIFVHAHYLFIPPTNLGLGLGLGIGLISSTADTDDTQQAFGSSAFPLDLKLVWSPFIPVVIHAGGALDYHRLSLGSGDDALRHSGLGVHAFGGGGIQFFFGGLGLLLDLQVRRRWYGEADFRNDSAKVTMTDYFFTSTFVW
jgi:hypothetical protein